MNIFKPEDFRLDAVRQNKSIDLDASASMQANLKLQKLIESWPVVYGYGETPMASSLWNMNGPEKEWVPHTHKARLAFIEEIVKDCKHEPDLLYITTPKGTAQLSEYIDPKHVRCRFCQVELQATWSEKK